VTVAAVLGEQALDPPRPDARFLQKVRPTPFALPKQLLEERQAAELRAFFQTLGAVLSCMNALTRIESRILGARAAGSRDGIRLQTTSYKCILRQMAEDSAKLSELGEAAAESVVGTGVFRSAKLRAARHSGKGIWSAALQGRLRRIGLKKPAIAAARELLRNARARRLLLSPQGPKRLFGLVSVHVDNAVRQMHIESATLLSSRRSEEASRLNRSQAR
jgi:hypothetical protein